jgi:RNA polymerase sigma-70 factor (ECF subfamily)
MPCACHKFCHSEKNSANIPRIPLILTEAVTSNHPRVTSQDMNNSPSSDASTRFLGHMLKNQRSIRNYLFSLHPRAQDLDDLVQQTALTLWKGFDRYDTNRDFLPWALRVAYFEVLRMRKKQSRDRLVFSDELLDILALDTPGEPASDPARQALDDCLAKLDTPAREVLLARYSEGSTVNGLAASQRVSVHRLYRMLDSARAALVACVRRQLHHCAGPISS